MRLTRLYVLFFVKLDRRQVWVAGATAHPTVAWLARQGRNLLADLDEHAVGLRFLIRDHDSKSGVGFDAVFIAAGAEVLTTPARTPVANASAVVARPTGVRGPPAATTSAAGRAPGP